MELTCLMTYQMHESWRRKLFTAMHATPVVAADSAPGIADILAADQRIWIMLAEQCADGIRSKLNGARPMEEKLQAILDSHELTTMLICRPRAKATVPDKQPNKQNEPNKPNPKGKPRVNIMPQRTSASRNSKSKSNWAPNQPKRRATIAAKKTQGRRKTRRGQRQGQGPRR